MREAEGALRSASDVFAQAGRAAATDALHDGVTSAVKNAGIDTAIGIGDAAIKGAQAEGGDGSESQSRIDGDLSFGDGT